MDKRAVASLKAIRAALPFNHPDTKLLYMAAFGSQVRGTERPDSDLDIFYVVDDWSFDFDMAVKRAGRRAPGGMHDINTFSYSLSDVREHANLYGSPIHDVLRGIGGVDVMYQAERLDCLLAEPDLGWCAAEWLDIAGIHLRRAVGDDHGVICFHASLVIDYSLRSCLLHFGVRFPRTRDIRVLHGMLPVDIRLDLEAVNYWRDHIKHPDNHYSEEDARTAVEAARRTHDIVGSIIRSR